MTSVAVVGAGVMGSGIAQLAAMHGCLVSISDVSPEIAGKAIDGIAKTLDRLIQKDRLNSDQRQQIIGRLQIASGPQDLGACDLVIEAVAERLDVKLAVLGAVRRYAGPTTIFASNTSSLSITGIGKALGEGRRMVGMHFFNPAPVMPLVEVVTGAETEPGMAERVSDMGRAWGKTVVRAKDTPGFIVNRVARGYYLESLRLLGEGVAGVEEIDRVLRELGGFRMGPFELMDLVGMDVNYSVSNSVWEQLGRPARLTPHPIQARLFEEGRLGRKTGCGFYRYEQEPAVPDVAVDERPLLLPSPVIAAVEAFARRAALRPAPLDEHYILARVLVTILNEAARVLEEGVATREDIDTAMRLGTSYPHGPLEWADTIGVDECHRLLLALNADVDDGRFAPAGLLAAGAN